MDVKLQDPAIAERHASVELTQVGLVVQGLALPNGLYVGGEAVSTATVSLDGGHFFIGHTSVTVREPRGDDGLASGDVPGLVGDSGAMKRLRDDITRYARLRAPVLLQGESGTGKDVVARALHVLSGRPGAYVPLNVGAISESLADSELFGHARGAFTGALQSRAGAFEEAHGGTLLLDEIADLAPAIQVKLLRVIEDGHVRALGGSGYRQVDTRVISATWADLQDCVASGTFRPDLYHRISTVVLYIPPLRERRSDLPALAHHLLATMQLDLGPKRLTPRALGTLGGYAWPGNVRELASVLYRAAVSSRGPEVDEVHVLRSMPALAGVRSRGLSADVAQQLVEAEQGNISAAARVAGVPRSTFRGWLSRGESAQASA